MTKVASPPSLPESVSCPKLPRISMGYRYYAGYSHSFVHDILSRWPKHALVLDPWNGSGTTTSVAAESGLDCIGVELNPAMVVVARAALLGEEDVLAIRRQACELRKLRSAAAPLDSDDPLLEWLDGGNTPRAASFTLADPVGYLLPPTAKTQGYNRLSRRFPLAFVQMSKSGKHYES